MASPKKNKKKTEAAKPAATRVRKDASYKSFRLSKRIQPGTQKSLPKARALLVDSVRLLAANWRIFAMVLAVYGFLTIVFVRLATGGLDIGFLREDFELTYGNDSGFVAGLAIFSTLLQSVGSANSDITSMYQFILLLIAGLALIWTLRQIYAHAETSLKGAYYDGTHAVVPFLLVLGVLSLQLLPMIIGFWVFATVTSGGIAVTGQEQFVWSVILFLLGVLSLYMLCSSVFALFIVTIAKMTPLKALRSARQLVLHRRWTVMRKILFLPFAFLIAAAVIFLPLIMVSWLNWLVDPLFFIATIVGFGVIVTYMYGLYRELL